MYTLYEYAPSGNSYKLRLAMTQLGEPFKRINLDITKGESRRPEFLEINSNGRVPVLILDNGERLPESNAVLWYLADGTPLLPTSKLEQAQVLQWMFFEQYSHEPFIATARYWIFSLDAEDKYKAKLEENRPKGYAALDVMEKHLSENDFFVGGKYSIADIALYAYTHVAEQGGYSLDAYPAIKTWFARIEAQENYIPITY